MKEGKDSEPSMYDILGVDKMELERLVRDELGKAMSAGADAIAAYIADDVAMDICDTADAEKWNDCDLRLAIGRVLSNAVESYY